MPHSTITVCVIYCTHLCCMVFNIVFRLWNTKFWENNDPSFQLLPECLPGHNATWEIDRYIYCSARTTLCMQIEPCTSHQRLRMHSLWSLPLSRMNVALSVSEMWKEPWSCLNSSLIRWVSLGQKWMKKSVFLFPVCSLSLYFTDLLHHEFLTHP